MFILLKVPLYVQTKLSMWLEEHITKWTEKSNHQYKAPPAYMDHGRANMSSVERSCFSVFKIVKKIKPKSAKIKSLFVCLGEVLNPYHFLQS